MQVYSLYSSYRKFVSHIMMFIIMIFSCITVLPFFYIVFYICKKGMMAINWELLTHLPTGPGGTGGGLANGIVGSIIMVGLACLVGVPWGGTLGICLSEYRSSAVSKVLRFVVDLSTSTPSIVIGIFVYSCVVVLFGFSAYAGALSLMIILLPIVARSSEEIFKLVPQHVREAGLALGSPRWKVIMKILIPGTLKMLLSGVILAMARISGETAPLLFTALGNQYFSNTLSEPIASLPVQIYEFSKSGFANLETIAWGGSLLLITFVFLINFSTRFIIFMTHSYDGSGLSR